MATSPLIVKVLFFDAQGNFTRSWERDFSTASELNSMSTSNLFVNTHHVTRLEGNLPEPEYIQLMPLGALHFITALVLINPHGESMGLSAVWPFGRHEESRTSPAQPILSSAAFLSSIKMSPEEWKQSLTAINPKPNTAMAPIHCSISHRAIPRLKSHYFSSQLFIPALQIFAISDNIPFHVQLMAPLAS
ncbi:hypothetical protein ARMGADRAFT_1089447 [Armillaria gallica]|uniref:Uncharacterized protein n=1 Tax=Armillaria gallica TaxID=47427 RepID=A0A2H3D769_ARMGA|nr:hypothetical protein ARMGADRAFT_1089447 [Armillaria gallica]